MTSRVPIQRVRRGPPRRGSEPDEKYKAWIRKLPCVVCERARITSYRWVFLRIEAAHVGERGMSQMAPDRQTLPLCVFHHTAGPQSHHRLGKRFWAFWGFSRFELIENLNARYEQETKKC